MSLVAGGSATYSMTVTNNNSANCTNNDFDLKAIIPAGWTVASSSPVISVAPGSSISASVQISPPTGQANGIYTVSIGAANAQNGGYAAALPRDLSVFSSLDVTAATDKASYNSGSTVLMTANVFANSSPISGVNVTFTLAKPNGKVVTGSAMTNASGISTFTYRMNKRQDPTGNYSVTASSSLSGAVGSAGTSFVVR